MNSNIFSLSSKYYDVDDRHAFEGDHVLLKQGYSAVIQPVLRGLKMRGKEKFEFILNFPAGKVEYGRKSVSESYGRDSFGREKNLIELSDTCSVTSVDGNTPGWTACTPLATQILTILSMSKYCATGALAESSSKA